MQKDLRAAGGRMGFPWIAFLMATACALALGAAPLRGQDDTGAAPPAPDNSAPAPDEANGAPDESASFQTFYDALGSQGSWIQSSDYGYVWQPQVDDPDWAPYTAGHWVYTDDGWAWVSDEPWGWATYHYGRWVNLDGTGWVWVPGYAWAPAWVSWRYGDGVCGWAPLPPDSFVGVDYSGDGYALGVGFHIGGDCDGFYGIGAGCYIFLPVNCLGYRHYHGYYRDRHDNFAIINHTTNVTNINVSQHGGAATRGGSFHRVTTGGPMLAEVNAVSQTPVQKVSLVRTNQPGGGGALTASSLALYAPHVTPGATAAQPSRVAGSIGQATINRGTDIMRPLAVNSRLTPSVATETQVQQARVAQNHAPASAKVITDSASVKPLLQTPLTSLKPMTREATPSRTFNPASSTFSNTERAPSASGGTPTVRTFPQAGEGEGSSRVFNPRTVSPTESSPGQPHATGAGAGGGSEPRTFVRPTTPESSAPAAASAHQSSGGGYGGNGGSSNGGGGSRTESSGGGSGGSSRAGGSTTGGTTQQGH